MISIFLVTTIVYLLLRFTNITDNDTVDFVGGFLIGLLISFFIAWISVLLKKKKATKE